MKRLHSVSALLAGILAFMPFTDAFAYNYILTDLGTLGGASSSGRDINNNGWVTGESVTADGYTHAFLYDGTAMRDLGTLGGTESYGTAINSSGWITGRSYPTEGAYDYQAFIYDGNSMLDISGGSSSVGADINANGWVTGSSAGYAFLYDGTTMHNLGDIGGSWPGSNGFGINNNGWVTGSSAYNFTHQHAFLYDGNTMQDFFTLCSSQDCVIDDTYGSAINDLGWIAGWHFDHTFMNAFIYDGNSILELETDYYLDSRANDINNQGWVVGNMRDSSTSSGFNAFLYDGSSMLDLCVLTDCTANGWDALTAANGINDHGDITGEGTINGETHAFLLTAVPIPSTLWLFCSGVFGLIGVARRKATS